MATTTRTARNGKSARPAKSRSGARSSSSAEGEEGQSGSASSMILNLVSGAMGDSLSDVVTNLKTKVTEQVSIHGEEYLDAARESISEVTSKVVEWGKKNPVKTVAAAAALIAVSGFLYATLNGKSGQMAGKASGR